MKTGIPSVRASIALLALSLPVVGGWARVAQRTPADAARELIAADRALAASAAGYDLVTAMSRAYARDVVVPDRAANGF
ncbi:MAG TPA: hypothetical protein VFV33_23465, partial [Gemmatimonadaceae bacterium]|nr:hypothetical protein [Gemmatimonadaceae bacterium]